MEWTSVIVITFILNFIIIFITCYLLFLLIKSKAFKIFPCYNITIISFVIFFDNILRIIYVGEVKVLMYMQAYLLTFLDKLLLTAITSQAIITYLGVCQTKIYFNNEKKIFLSTLIIGIAIGMILSLIYILAEDEVAHYNTYYYCGDSMTKRILDTIFNGVFLAINFYCCLVLLIFISKKRKEASLGIIEDLDYSHHHTKIILMFIVNSILFIQSYLIIYDSFPSNEVDLIYLITCLIVLAYYTINKITIKETLRIFCPGYYEKKYPLVKKSDSLTGVGDGDEEGGKTGERTESFSDD